MLGLKLNHVSERGPWYQLPRYWLNLSGIFWLQQQNIEFETKWMLFCRQHFQMHFLEWKCVNFTYISVVYESPQQDPVIPEAAVGVYFKVCIIWGKSTIGSSHKWSSCAYIFQSWCSTYGNSQALYYHKWSSPWNTKWYKINDKVELNLSSVFMLFLFSKFV